MALSSDKKFCAVPLWARVDILQGLIELYKLGHGEVIVATDPHGSQQNTLRYNTIRGLPLIVRNYAVQKAAAGLDVTKMPGQKK